LEALGYGVGAADLSAAGVGAPHIRQRLWWCGMDNPASARHQATGQGAEAEAWNEARMRGLEFRRSVGGMAEPVCEIVPDGVGRSSTKGTGPEPQGRHAQPDCAGPLGGADGNRSHCWSPTIAHRCRDGKTRRVPAKWMAYATPQPGIQPLVDGLPSRMDGGGTQGDGEEVAGWQTPTSDLVPDPDLFPLAEAVPGRLGLLKGSGNSIVPMLAKEFILCFTT